MLTLDAQLAYLAQHSLPLTDAQQSPRAASCDTVYLTLLLDLA
jgi:hypothetical protein